MTNKEKLVSNLLGLMSGNLAPNDLKAKDLSISIGYGADNLYHINGVNVSKSDFDIQNSKQETNGFIIDYHE